MTLKKIIFLFLSCTVALSISAQVGINGNGGTPNSSAGLDIDFANKGLLMPRMTAQQRDAIQNPALSLLIYNTTSNCYESYNGILWQSVICLCTSAPAAPGAIIGSTTPCAGATNVPYSIVGVNGATSYTWSVPDGATVSAGQGGTSVLINFGSTSGNVEVVANNSCGVSNPAVLTVTLDSAPESPGSITGDTSPCIGASGVSYSIPYVNGATTYTWSVPAGSTVVSGQGTNAVEVNFGSIAGNISVTAGNACETSQAANAAIDFDTPPSTPGPVSGSASACANSSGNVYSISSVNGATSYTWTAPSGATITNGQGSNSVTVTFGANSGNVTVTADNACGSSTSNGIAVTLAGGAPGSQTFSYIGSIETFTVPACVNSVTIEAWGAEGGRGKEYNTGSYATGVPGKGARMKGTVTTTPGETLKVLVGQRGGEKLVSVQLGGGGGGGSFVTRNDNTPLVIAGGGGGSGRYNGNNGVDGTINNSGTNGNGSPAGSGGSGGNGGTTPSCDYAGGSGAGLTGNGQNHGGTNAQAFINGGAGASAGTSWNDGNVGGFGGGGGTGPHGGGGGGGYSGGGGGGDINCGSNGGGGGGGSFNNGTNQSNSSGVQSGNGQVIITW